MKTLALIIAAAALSATPASAARVLFSFTGSGQTGSGTFTTAEPQGSGGTPIIGIEGLFNGRTISGLTGFAGADNLFAFADPIRLSFNGVSFTDAGGISTNFYYSTRRGSYALFTSASGTAGADDDDVFEVTASFTPLDVGAVPEPGVWALMLLGFGALGGALRRRPRQALATA